MTDAQLTYKVEIDVSGGSFGAAFSATDVSAKAVAGLGFEPVSITWGRQDQYSDVSPTTVQGSLLNTDGTFSPGNASGTYYPHIRRGLRRRVSVGVNATTVQLSEDYATSIEVVPAHDTPAVTNIDGADILARFGKTASTQAVSALDVGTTMRSFLAEEMLLDLPTFLYPLQEGDGATSFADVTGTCPPLRVTNSKYGAGVITAGQSPSSTFQGGTLVGLTNANYGVATPGGSWLECSTTATLFGSGYTIEAWVQTPTTTPAAATSATIFMFDVSTGGTPIRLYIDSSGHVSLSGDPVTATSICDGKVHQIVVTYDGTTTTTIYVDGVSAASSSFVVAGGLPTIRVGAWGDVALVVPPGLSSDRVLSGAVAYVGYYSGTALSAGRISAHYQAGTAAFAGESTNARITRLLSYRPNTGSNLDTGLGTMGVQDIAGRSLQDCLLEVGQVEAGAVFVDGTGRVNLRSRSRLFNPTPTLTLDMSVGGVDFGTNWREDTQNTLNDVTVTNSTTGSDQRFHDAVSITLDGEFATSVSLPLNSDTDALNLAGWMVINGTQQQLTATPLVVNLLHLSAAQAQAVLQLAPLDCLQLTNCPTPAPASTMTFIVQGGTISLGADAATATLNLTPKPYPVAVWDSTNWDSTAATWAF